MFSWHSILVPIISQFKLFNITYLLQVIAKGTCNITCNIVDGLIWFNEVDICVPVTQLHPVRVAVKILKPISVH